MTTEIPVLYEDNHLLIGVKPSSLPTQPVSDYPLLESAESLLKEMIKKRDKKPNSVFLHTIFRLDAPVCGLILFAKSAKALSRLQEIQRQHLYTKEYIALVHSTLENVKVPKPGQILTDFLIKQEFHGISVSSETDKAKKAELEICSFEKILSHTTHGTIYKVRLKLKTGRYHQIRIQLSNRGFPILGDTKYGGMIWSENIAFTSKAIALCHTHLSFYHPIQKEGSHEYISLHYSPEWEFQPF